MLQCNSAILKNKGVEKLSVIPETEKIIPQNKRREEEEASPQ